MKSKILFFGILLLCMFGFNAVYSQGNLQFNQAKLVSTSQTVPAGKVWKVESALMTNSVSPPAQASHFDSNTAYITVNGNNVAVEAVYIARGVPSHQWIGQNMAETQLTALPIWLPAATTLAASSNVVYVSVLEFNIIN